MVATLKHEPAHIECGGYNKEMHHVTAVKWSIWVGGGYMVTLIFPSPLMVGHKIKFDCQYIYSQLIS